MTLPDRCPYYATDPYGTSRSRDDNWRCGQIRNHLRSVHVLYSSDGESILDQSVTGWEKRGEHARPYDAASEREKIETADTMGRGRHEDLGRSHELRLYDSGLYPRIADRLAALDASVHK